MRRENNMLKYIKTFGPLRIPLITLVVVDMILRPEPGSPVNLEGFGVITDLIAPVLVPILFMLLLLDAIMTGVYMSSMQGEKKVRYRVVLFTDLLLAVIFIWYWIPYFKALNF
jgi:hypothetical protein